MFKVSQIITEDKSKTVWDKCDSKSKLGDLQKTAKKMP